MDSDFPGYAEAVAQENLVRGVACLGLNERICGLEVRPLTAWHVRWLMLNRSPFLGKYPAAMLCAKPDIVDDIMRFLWIVSPLYKPGSKPTAGWRRRVWPSARDRFNRRYSPIVKQKLDQVVAEILQYMDEAYLDAGEGSTGEKSYYEFEIAVAHEMHEVYGLPIDFWVRPPGLLGWLRDAWRNWNGQVNPIHIPLKIVFQLRKCRQKWNDPKALLTNRSEMLISKGLEKINADFQRTMEYESELAKQPSPSPETLPRLKPFELN